MANYAALIEAMRGAVLDWLGPEYICGYEVGDDADPDNLTRFDAECKAHWRKRLGRNVGKGRPGAADDLAAIPADASGGAGHHILVEIMHRQTRIQTVRCYGYGALAAIVANPGASATVKRGQIRALMQAQATECRARVVAAGG